MRTTYRFVIRGRVTSLLDIYRDEFTIDLRDSTTILRGPVIDAAQLHGMISHLTAVGLELVEVTSSQPPD